MGRVPKKRGAKGSLKWLQKVINDAPRFLDDPIRKYTGLPDEHKMEWLSPLKSHRFAEYRDEAFLDLLGISLPSRSLQDFWPNQGPQWDALGRTEDGSVFLVEAKANILEIVASSTAKAAKSIELINRSLNETREGLKIKSDYDWSSGLYQYANRLAHLYLLRVLNDVRAYLVFVYFLNDATHVPTKKKEWDGAIQLLHSLLGTGKHKLKKYIIDVFIDVGELK